MDDPAGIQVRLLPQSGEPEDSDWQAQCELLVRQLQVEMRELDSTVTVDRRAPTTIDGESARAIDMAIFSSFILLALKPETMSAVAGRVSTLLTQWLNKRKGSRAVIRTKDGSEFTFENLSNQEVLSLMERSRV